jgi:hypothetical protein
MKPRRQTSRTQRPDIWTATDWERGWRSALMRMYGAPAHVAKQRIFQESVAVLNGAFADGSSQRFQLGLITLLDFCAEAVNTGGCKQWW